MTKNYIKSIVIAATVTLALMGGTIAFAEDTQKDAQSLEGDFPSLLKIHRSIDSRLPDLSEAQLERIMAEHSAFLKDNQRLFGDLKSKWASLADELLRQGYETETALLLQEEIMALDIQLAEQRLDHLMTVENMSSNPAGR